MDKDNFAFVIDGHTVSMVKGVLYVDDSQYEEDASPVEYAMTRYVALRIDCHRDDLGFEPVVMGDPVSLTD